MNEPDVETAVLFTGVEPARKESGKDSAKTAAAVGMFLVASAESFNIFSAMNSSPWTAENFGADERRANSAKEYVIIACLANEALGVGASLIGRSPWPLVGTTAVSGFMCFIYWRALQRGKDAGAEGWHNA